ncbi:MAG: class I adenylate cyclase [Candidatus Adiutricales bacterium]
MTTYDKSSNLAHIGRRMVQNQSAFSLNNIMRIQELFKQSSRRFEEVFQTIPVLLQMNQPLVPGYIKTPDAPCGIYGFNRSGFFRLDQGLVKKFNLDRRQILSSQSVIESLFLLGGSGPAGYATTSDLDYWVCVDRKELSAAQLRLLNQKLELITRWAEEIGDIDVNFFLFDPQDIDSLASRPDSDPESVNMPGILIEEAYRSLLLLVGRAPLWWVMPLEIDASEYERISKNLDQIPNPNFFPQDFIDLGFPNNPFPKEYIGAARWQLKQAMTDPFGAVVKMVLILEQANSSFSLPLLCDAVKDRVFTYSSDQFPIDPDILTSQRVLDFCREGTSSQRLELIRTSVFFNLYTPARTSGRRRQGSRERVLGELLGDWGWSSDKIKYMEDYTSWPVSQKLHLNEEINTLLKDLYTEISTRIKTELPDQDIHEDQNLANLHLRLLVYHSSLQARIEDLPSTRFRQSLPKNLILVKKNNQWCIYTDSDDRLVFKEGEKLIYTALRATRAAAWVIHNRLWHPHGDLHLRVDPWILVPETLSALMSQITELFPSIKSRDLKFAKRTIPEKSGSQLLVINLEEPEEASRIQSAEIIYRMTWGELCHEMLEIDQAQSEAEKYLFLATSLLKNGEVGSAGIHFFVPAASENSGVKENLKNAFSKYNYRGAEIDGQVRKQKSKVRLDRG